MYPDRPAAPSVAVKDIETTKAALVTPGVVAAFVLSDWQCKLIALGGASVLLVNRQIPSSDLLRHVAGQSAARGLGPE